MRLNYLLLPLFFSLCLLNNPLQAQCNGSPGFVSFPNALCVGSQADVSIDGLDVPDGYVFQLYVTTGDPFLLSEVVSQSDVAAIFDTDIPNGTYYLYTAISPEGDDGAIDFEDPCFQISAAIEMPFVEIVLNDQPDSLFATCASPTISVTASDQTHPLVGYTWFGPNGFTSSENTIEISIAGHYSVRAATPSGSFCSASESFYFGFSDFTLPQVREFTVPCTGAYEVCIEPYDEDQFYLINGALSDSGPCYQNLGIGNHVLEISHPDCSNAEIVVLTVLNSELEIVISDVNEASCATADGSATVTINGGTPPYDLSFSNGTFTTINEDGGGIVLANLEEGTIIVNAEDASGCIADNSFTVLQANLFQEIQVVNTTCENTEDGSITIIPGDDPPYSYLWSNGETGSQIGNLSPGLYNVTISSGSGCTQQEILNVTDLSNLNVIGATFHTTCGATDGQIDLTVTGGSAPYTFEWADLPGGDGLQEDRDNLAAGTYSVIVTDVNGCTTSGSFVIVELSSFTITADVIGTDCSNETGSILLTIDGGPGGYTFDWEDLVGNDDPEDRTNLAAGNYAVTVTDQNGCTEQASYLVFSGLTFNSSSVTQPATCGESNGSIQITVSGGTAPFTYSWQDISDPGPPSRDGLASGPYTVTITDDEGCTETLNIFVGEESDLDPTIIQSGNLLCDDFVTLTLQLSDNTGPVTIEWVSPIGEVIGTSNSIIVTDGIIGHYTVTVFSNDDPSCIGTATSLISNSAETFQIIVAPGLPCQPMELEAPFGTYFNGEWDVPEGAIIGFEGLSVTATVEGWYVYSATDLEETCTVVDSLYVGVPTPCGWAQGTLLLDEGDCLSGGDEMPISAALIELSPINGNLAEMQYALTDSDGNWLIQVPYGDYQVNYLPNVEGLYASCTTYEVNVTNAGPSPNIEQLVTAVEECPRVWVDLATPFLRRCFNTQQYIQYCNEGTAVAENATITIELDEFLIFQSSFPIPSQVSGNTLTFQVGDLAPGQCGQIQMTVYTSCNAVLGQSHCISVSATPNAPCPTPDDEWGGAIVEVHAECGDDGLPIFVVKNIGTGAMTVPLSYIIVEDGVILMPEGIQSPPLSSGQEITIPLPGNGASYWIQTNQEPQSPGAMMPTSFLENCSFDPDGNFSIGFANQFFDGDDLHWYEERCVANIGAYDPNDKQAIPIGYGTPHYIEPATPLEYTIRFQNTGTDTAFNIFILDELSPLLDPRTLRMGASSHDYNASLDSNSVLDIRFDNIMLPDSNIDLAASQGFVQFTIAPYPDLPLPSLIENNAGIYFDFNEPVITNTVFHTVDTGFVRMPSSVRGPLQPLAQIVISPNPMSNGQATLDLQTGIVGPYLILVQDGLGRRLKAIEMEASGLSLDLSDLPNGTYTLAAFDRQGRWLGSQKIIR